MIRLLIKRRVKDYKDVNNINIAASVGRLLAVVGIFFNILLFGCKFVVGSLIGSISIQADAINNLCDSFTNIVSIVSFVISQRPADEEHPYGHERMEMIGTLVVGLMIVLFGFEIGKESVLRILHPKPLEIQWISFGVLLFSVVIKSYMFAYNNKYADVYHSKMLQASALDSISDVAGTFAIIISILFSIIIGYNLDGFVGLIVSLLILWNAYKLIREVIDSLLGEAPDKEMMSTIDSILMESDIVFMTHDMMIHSYGSHKQFASAHVEVDSSLDIFEIHDEIDRLERLVKEKTNVELVLHMDPILVNDPKTDYYRNRFERIIVSIDSLWSFHDFRIQTQEDGILVSFDLVVPYDEKRNEEDIKNELYSRIHFKDTIHLQITIDHPF